MTLFDITVYGPDAMYQESFRLFGTSKRHAMEKAIRVARKCDNVKGELSATAKVVR